MPRVRRKRKYGTGSVSRDGTFWRVRWREGKRPRSQSQFPTRELAELFLAGMIGELARGHARLEPDLTKTPVLSILAAQWFRDREGPNNRNNEQERLKWLRHLEPELGRFRPDEVTDGQLKALIASKLQSGRIRRLKLKNGRIVTRGQGRPDGLSSTTVLQLVRILGSLYTHLLEERLATTSPVRLLSKNARRKIRPAHDWRNTPYLKRPQDSRSVYGLLPEPVNKAYAIGRMRGARPGEIRALPWSNVDLENRLITIDRQISNGKVGPPKGGRSRTVSISDELHPVLVAWHLKTGGKGLVIRPVDRKRRRGPGYIGDKAFGRELDKALTKLELPRLTWYQATRHTFGSHWVLQNGSLEKLALILGHSTVEVTKRYAHLRPEQLGAEDTARAQVDLSPGEVVALRAVPRDVPCAELVPSAKLPKKEGSEKKGKKP